MFRFFCFFTLLAGFALSACGSTPSYEAEDAGGPLLPMPAQAAAIDEPGNSALMTTVAAYVASQAGPANSQYEFTRIDLDDDGRQDGLVLMKSPHSHWCSLNGCPLLVFKADNDSFTLVSDISPVRGPLIVSDDRTNGWRDIVVRVSGRTGFDAKDVAMRFDGASYPPQPAFQPAMRIAGNLIPGVQIFP